jgi:transposase
LSTKIHALVDALGRIVDVALSPGQAADIVAAHALLDSRCFRGLIADRAYDADHLTVPLRERGVNVVIPSTRSRRTAILTTSAPTSAGTSSSASSASSSASAASRRDTTSSPSTSAPPPSSPQPSLHPIDDTP